METDSLLYLLLLDSIYSAQGYMPTVNLLLDFLFIFRLIRSIGISTNCLGKILCTPQYALLCTEPNLNVDMLGECSWRCSSFLHVKNRGNKLIFVGCPICDMFHFRYFNFIQSLCNITYR